jgi:hypothetical protein
LHLEYHSFVRRSIAASATLSSIFLLLGFLVANGQAQVIGAVAPPTSGVGHSVTGTVPSVAGSVRPPTGPVIPPTSGLPGSAHNTGPAHPGNGEQHHNHFVPYVPPVAYGVGLPYAVDIGAIEEQNNSDADDEDADSYISPDDQATSEAVNRAAESAPDPDPPEPTLLVFKDGHELEILNYAIVEQTLLDLTPGHARKVPLGDLDLEATRTQNENRGITFQVPALSQAN